MKDKISLLDLKIMKQKASNLTCDRIRCKINDEEFDLRYENIINEKNIFIETDKIISHSYRCLKINPLALSFLKKEDRNHFYKTAYQLLKRLCSMSAFEVSFDKRKKIFILFEKKELWRLFELKDKSKSEPIILNDKQKSILIDKFFSKKYFNLYDDRNRIRGVSLKIRYEVFKEDNYTCTNCKDKGLRSGGKAILHIDHIIPVTSGGSNDRKNLQTLCRKCNLEKSDKI